MASSRNAFSMQLAALALCFAAGTACAGLTDIASAPLASAGAKPNIMLVLDDSGSMQWSYLGDSVKPNGYPNTVGYRNALCNKLYYNPSNVYLPPVQADGTLVAAASFGAAWVDGYLHADNDSRVDLGSQFRAWRSFRSDPGAASWDCWDGAGHCEDTGDGVLNSPGPAYYFTYKGQRRPQLGDGSALDDCKDTLFDSGPEGGANWTKVVVGASSGAGGSDERENFANWYSYYRTRILLMKTSLIRALRELDDSYRIGYSTIGYTGADSANSAYLGIADFTVAHKGALFAKLSGLTVPSAGTPLRGALSKAGRMYAGRLAAGGSDPVQYSCQQNFTILSTDGYWNNNIGWSGNEDASYGPLDLDGNPVGNVDALLPRPQYDGTPAAGSTSAGGGAADTLADVAAYYYRTDLRQPVLGNCSGALGADVCSNNVPVSADDPASHQHMSTFTLGLGVSGTLRYDPDYPTMQSGDFADIRNGLADWPPPVTFGPARVDDLWHAAVNGGGYYFSAADSATLASTLSSALARVRARNGAAAAVATSRLEPIAGDNQVFLASYRSVVWDGELEARSIAPDSGQVSAVASWSARDRLQAQANSGTRVLLTDDPGAQDGSRLKPFTWRALTDQEKALFENLCAPDFRLSQCADLDALQRSAMSGERLLAYLRGASIDASGPSALFRRREGVLGDIVNAQPLYVAAPPSHYADSGYLAFKAAQSARQAMVYAAANDGMLHAFRASGNDAGSEAWAYLPALVLPGLYRLADRNYAAQHRYLLDATPVAGDICPKTPPAACDAGEWRTILVGGYGAGGRGYYALDITDPAVPRALWKVTAADDADLGLSFGNPVIAKRADGAWVVAYASGYNNVSPGDGGGYLTVLDAASGRRLHKIATGAGSVDAPSGLARISAWVDSPSDNTASRIYGGDLFGNVWRFDIDAGEAVRLAQLGQLNGAGMQPVTTRPELALVRHAGKPYPVVVVGTGSMLGATDLASVSRQSIYVLKDDLQAAGLGQVRSDGVLVRQQLSADGGGRGRIMTAQPVDWARSGGWYVDLDPGGASPGERVNVDIQVELGMLKAVGNVPSGAVCSQGGSAWLYRLDLATGAALTGTTAAAMLASSQSTLTGVNTLRLAGGATTTLAADSAGGIGSYADPGTPPGPGRVKRVDWREVAD